MANDGAAGFIRFWIRRILTCPDEHDRWMYCQWFRKWGPVVHAKSLKLVHVGENTFNEVRAGQASDRYQYRRIFGRLAQQTLADFKNRTAAASTMSTMDCLSDSCFSALDLRAGGTLHFGQVDRIGLLIPTLKRCEYINIEVERERRSSLTTRVS